MRNLYPGYKENNISRHVTSRYGDDTPAKKITTTGKKWSLRGELCLFVGKESNQGQGMDRGRKTDRSQTLLEELAGTCFLL